MGFPFFRYVSGDGPGFIYGNITSNVNTRMKCSLNRMDQMVAISAEKSECQYKLFFSRSLKAVIGVIHYDPFSPARQNIEEEEKSVSDIDLFG